MQDCVRLRELWYRWLSAARVTADERLQRQLSAHAAHLEMVARLLEKRHGQGRGWGENKASLRADDPNNVISIAIARHRHVSGENL